MAMNRRRFLKVMSSGIACIGASTCLPHVEGGWDSCEGPEPDGNPLQPASHRVVEVFLDRSVSNITYEIDQRAVSEMLSAGLLALTGESSLPEAWNNVLPERQDGDKISLKVNTLNSIVPTSPELSAAIADSLVGDYQLPPEEIFVWDRSEQDLHQAGITPERVGVACRGTVKSAQDPTGIGYEQQYVCLSGKKIYLSGLLTLESPHLINASVMKNHSVAGFTGCLKNHFGSFSNPWDFHQDCSKHIANLNAIPQVSQTSRLFVLDALLGVCLGDTDRPFDCIPKRLLLSFDPVAIDQRGLEVRDEMRAELGRPAGEPADYLQMASELGLGSTEYEIIQIDLDE